MFTSISRSHSIVVIIQHPNVHCAGFQSDKNLFIDGYSCEPRTEKRDQVMWFEQKRLQIIMFSHRMKCLNLILKLKIFLKNFFRIFSDQKISFGQVKLILQAKQVSEFLLLMCSTIVTVIAYRLHKVESISLTPMEEWQSTMSVNNKHK